MLSLKIDILAGAFEGVASGAPAIQAVLVSGVLFLVTFALVFGR